MQDKQCAVCRATHPIQIHHWLTRKRWGKRAEHPDNKIYLCFYHHTGSKESVHVMGIDSFAERFGFIEEVEKARKAVWPTTSA